MRTTSVYRSIPLLCLVGLLAWLGPTVECQAQKKTQAEKAAEKAAKDQQKAVEKAVKDQQKAVEKAAKDHQKAMEKAVEHAKKILKEEFKGQESEALKVAYILIAAANHNYDGHRGKAMHQVEAAFERLDRSIMREGTLQQKIKTAQEDNIAEKAKILARNSAAIHEVQVLSDAQLRKAAGIIQVVGRSAIYNKQPVVVDHLRKALDELTIALAIR